MSMSWIIEWLNSDGALTTLTDPPYISVRWGELKGASTPDFRAITEDIPLTYESYLKHIDIENREIDLTLIVRGTDQTDLWNRLALLSHSFNPLQGDGKLRVKPPHLSQPRELVCRPISGFRLDESTMNLTSIDVQLTFLATKPFWRSITETVETFALDNPPKWFPIFPLSLGGEVIVSTFFLYNFGHVDAYPVWKITGPGSNPKLVNQSTGQYLSFTDVTLDGGQFITIDTENRIVEMNDGTNLLPKMDWGSSFWTLKPTTFEEGNYIKIEMPGATTDSSIEVRYRQYYLGVF